MDYPNPNPNSNPNHFSLVVHFRVVHQGSPWTGGSGGWRGGGGGSSSICFPLPHIYLLPDNVFSIHSETMSISCHTKPKLTRRVAIRVSSLRVPCGEIGKPTNTQASSPAFTSGGRTLRIPNIIEI